MYLRIGLDVDGVLARFDDKFALVLTDVTGKPCPIAEPDCWEWPKKLGFTYQERCDAWAWVEAHPEWWLTLQPYADSFWDYRALDAQNVDLYFITARRCAGVRRRTIQWLKRWYQIDAPIVLLSAEKGLAARALRLDVFLDDRPEVALDIHLNAPSTTSYLRARQHNQLAAPFVAADGVILTDSVQTFFAAVL